MWYAKVILWTEDLVETLKRSAVRFVQILIFGVVPGFCVRVLRGLCGSDIDFWPQEEWPAFMLLLGGLYACLSGFSLYGIVRNYPPDYVENHSGAGCFFVATTVITGFFLMQAD